MVVLQELLDTVSSLEVEEKTEEQVKPQPTSKPGRRAPRSTMVSSKARSTMVSSGATGRGLDLGGLGGKASGSGLGLGRFGGPPKLGKQRESVAISGTHQRRISFLGSRVGNLASALLQKTHEEKLVSYKRRFQSAKRAIARARTMKGAET